MMQSSFKHAVCAKFGCQPEGYVMAVFWHCLYTHARRPVRVLYFFWPKLFADDVDLIQALGKHDSCAGIRREMEVHRYHYPPTGIVREGLRLRVSGKKLAELAKELLPRKPGDTAFLEKTAAK